MLFIILNFTFGVVFGVIFMAACLSRLEESIKDKRAWMNFWGDLYDYSCNHKSLSQLDFSKYFKE